MNQLIFKLPIQTSQECPASSSLHSLKFPSTLLHLAEEYISIVCSLYLPMFKVINHRRVNLCVPTYPSCHSVIKQNVCRLDITMDHRRYCLPESLEASIRLSAHYDSYCLLFMTLGELVNDDKRVPSPTSGSRKWQWNLDSIGREHTPSCRYSSPLDTS